MFRVWAVSKYSLIVFCGFLLSGTLGAQILTDSIVTYYYPAQGDSVNGHKIASEYNSAGQLVSYSIYSWNKTVNQWEGWVFPCEECSSYSGRFEYSYDDKGKLALTRYFYWDYSRHKWVERLIGRREDGYDDRGNNVSVIFSLWNAAKNVWDPVYGYEYEYDETGFIISRTIYDRYPDPEIWHPLEKMLYTFDTSGRKTLETRQLWNDAARDWMNQVKTEWNYSIPGVTTEYVSYRWTLAGTLYEWQEDQRHRIIYEFDQAGQLVLIKESLKVSKTTWLPAMREERAYNSSGQMVLSVISKGAGALTEDFRSEWVYDSSGRLILETLTGAQHRWPGGMAIKQKAKTIRSFDAEGNLSRVIWQYWDAQTKSYIFSHKEYYFYHPASSGIREPAIDQIKAFPNPTSGILNFSGLTRPAEVKIYSMQGLLLRSIHQPEGHADLSGLASGAYILIVEEAGCQPFRTVLIRD